MSMDSFAFYISVLRKHFLAYCTDKLSGYDITYGQLFVLIYISKKNQCSPKQITEYLKLDAGQLNRILGKLIEKALIEQRKSKEDKRVNIVTVTENGRKIVEESRQFFYEWDQEILSEVDDTSRQELLDCMKKIVFRLYDKNGGKENE